MHQWNLEFVASSREGRRYEVLADEIDRALRFMAACGIDLDAEVQLHEVDFYTSHEALLLGYEEALTRRDSLTGDWYDCSAHLLWIGERTRQLDGAHVEFLSGVQNPIGVKLGPDVAPDEVVALCRAPRSRRASPGGSRSSRRMGADRSRECLPPLLRAVHAAGHPVVWACDPMHGNTFAHESGYKTRHFDDVMREVEAFFERCRRRRRLAGRRAHRAHRRRRHRVPRRRRRGARAKTSSSATRRCATRGSTPASRSTWRSTSPSSAAALTRQLPRLLGSASGPLPCVLVVLAFEVLAPRPGRHPDQHRDRAEERDGRADEQADVERVDERALRRRPRGRRRSGRPTFAATANALPMPSLAVSSAGGGIGIAAQPVGEVRGVDRREHAADHRHADRAADLAGRVVHRRADAGLGQRQRAHDRRRWPAPS